MVKLTLAVEEVREAAGAVKGVAQELMKAISNGDEVSISTDNFYQLVQKAIPFYMEIMFVSSTV